MIVPEFKRIQRLLSSFLGEPKADMSDNGQLQYNCPKCIEDKGAGEIGKYNLEVNLHKGVFKCWSCCSVDENMKGSLKTLIKKYGNLEILREYESIIRDIRNNELYKLPEFIDLFQLAEDKILTLPNSFTKITNVEKIPKKIKDYLNKRKITQDIIDKFNIGYTTWDDSVFRYRNRIIIPSYDALGNLNFWVGRDFTGNEKRTKYCNCDGIKTSIVFQESLINFDADITIVEGAIDCLYGNNTIALLGKTLGKNDELFKILREKANANIIICLDQDTTINETKRIYKLLDRGRLRGHIRYIRLEDYKDFGEAYESGGKNNIIKLIQNQQTFTEIELLI